MSHRRTPSSDADPNASNNNKSKLLRSSTLDAKAFRGATSVPIPQTTRPASASVTAGKKQSKDDSNSTASAAVTASHVPPVLNRAATTARTNRPASPAATATDIATFSPLPAVSTSAVITSPSVAAAIAAVEGTSAGSAAASADSAHYLTPPHSGRARTSSTAIATVSTSALSTGDDKSDAGADDDALSTSAGSGVGSPLPGPGVMKVQVACRVRPLIQREINERDTAKLQVTSTSLTVTSAAAAAGAPSTSGGGGVSSPAAATKTFTFDTVYGPEATQEQVYNKSVKPIIDQFVNGYNGCIFCYGQTGSGKTYTMYGSSAVAVGSDSSVSDGAGIIFRAVRQISSWMSANASSVYCKVFCEFVEIYQDKLRDLVGSGTDLEIYGDQTRGIWIKNVTSRQVSTYEHFKAVIEAGVKNRTVADTKMNETSSRSHSVFTIKFESGRINDPNGDEPIKTSQLHLVDLAGSERADRTGAVGSRLKEGAIINQSLTELGKVINALATGQKTSYRGSPLTRLLQNSLGGNSCTLMIANLSPAESSLPETRGTMEYANRAKQIKNKPVLNVDPKALRLLELTERIKKLEADNAALRGLRAAPAVAAVEPPAPAGVEKSSPAPLPPPRSRARRCAHAIGYLLLVALVVGAFGWLYFNPQTCPPPPPPPPPVERGWSVCPACPVCDGAPEPPTFWQTIRGWAKQVTDTVSDSIPITVSESVSSITVPPALHDAPAMISGWFSDMKSRAAVFVAEQTGSGSPEHTLAHEIGHSGDGVLGD